MNCQLLNLNTKEWQSRKLRIFADIKVVPPSSYANNTTAEINEIQLEFATDEPPTSDIETSLDEIRQLNLENQT
ncbi:MAG: KGK domain-containing protein [Cyanobacteria bacterium J06592_8]